jgi:mgtE-like transporter
MFKQTTFAYFFDILGLFAGLLIAYQLDIFTRTPWALALYPTLITTRIISGLLNGRLSTALHLGTIHTRFMNNTKSFYQLIESVIVLTLITSLAVSAISFAVGYFLWDITFTDFSAIILVMISTLAIGLTFTFVTIKVAFISFKRGLDPDIVVYPIVSTAASIFITLCYIGVLELFFLNSGIGKLAILAVGSIHVVLSIYLILKDRTEPEFVKTIKESLIMLMVVAVLVTFTGTVFKEISSFAKGRREIYTIFPALINMISNVGSVVGSTANTKLALGLLSPTLSSIRKHGKNIVSAWIASFLIFTILAVISLAINQVWTVSSAFSFLAVIWVSNIIAVIGIVLLSYGVAILTFRRGMNPENFVIPVETSFSTIITSTALLIALLALG